MSMRLLFLSICSRGSYWYDFTSAGLSLSFPPPLFFLQDFMKSLRYCFVILFCRSEPNSEALCPGSLHFKHLKIPIHVWFCFRELPVLFTLKCLSRILRVLWRNLLSEHTISAVSDAKVTFFRVGVFSLNSFFLSLPPPPHFNVIIILILFQIRTTTASMTCGWMRILLQLTAMYTCRPR